MYCHHCGKELAQGAAFCGGCGKAVGSTPAAPRSAPAKTVTVNVWILLIVAVAAIAVVLAVVFLRPGESGDSSRGSSQSQDDDRDRDEDPPEEDDPADALVGTWANSDGVGLTFTSGGVLRLSGFGLSLGGDTFHYEVTDDNELTLTATAHALVNFETTAPYYLLGDTLYIELGDFAFELQKK